ncbi:MAG: hypothetical protein ACJ06V_12220, partial [Verrucomicrobiota bacterium]
VEPLLRPGYCRGQTWRGSSDKTGVSSLCFSIQAHNCNQFGNELKDFVSKLYCREKEVTGDEIGVKEGIYSEHILKTWKGSTLFSIDA